MLTRALPAESVTLVVMVAVYMVLEAKPESGLKVATLVPALYPTEPVTPDKVKLAAIMVPASMASLKVASTLVLTATPVAALAGAVEITVGGILSVVVKVHT